MQPESFGNSTKVIKVNDADKYGWCKEECNARVVYKSNALPNGAYYYIIRKTGAAWDYRDLNGNELKDKISYSIGWTDLDGDYPIFLGLPTTASDIIETIKHASDLLSTKEIMDVIKEISKNLSAEELSSLLKQLEENRKQKMNNTKN